MTDIVPSSKRSEMMSGIKAKDTKPELLVRKALFSQGFRFRLHSKHLLGSPDIVLPKHRVVIFVHGCFWHHHLSCKYSRIPASRVDFWSTKLKANAARDAKVQRELLNQGWRVLIVWECHLRRLQNTISTLQLQLSNWIKGSSNFSQFPSSTNASCTID